MTDWFNALGKPVSVEAMHDAYNLAVDLGLPPDEARVFIPVIAREIQHDEPERAQKYMRRWIGSDETLVLRLFATLCSKETT